MSVAPHLPGECWVCGAPALPYCDTCQRRFLALFVASLGDPRVVEPGEIAIPRAELARLERIERAAIRLVSAHGLDQHDVEYARLGEAVDRLPDGMIARLDDDATLRDEIQALICRDGPVHLGKVGT
jgi:hypothetical protein